MKGKFNCSLFKNIKFVECEKSSDFKNLKDSLQAIDLSQIY